tara:strand:+ start:796 stop:1080 length:285 start_codon:yes stop_codon:yes gene_type:complete
MESMNILDIIINEPIYLVITLFLALIIIYSVLKKLFKVMILGLSAMIIYIFYLVYTGQDLPGDIQVEPIKKSIENSFDNAVDIIDNIIESNNNE